MDVITFRPARSPAEWERAQAGLPGMTAFHRHGFLQAVAPALGCRFVPLLARWRGRPVGVAPLLVKRLGPACTVNWVPFPYLGPLVPPSLLSAALSALAREGRRRRALNHQQSFAHPVAAEAAPGFVSSVERTFVTALSGRTDEDLLSVMQRGRRQQILRAQAAGLQVCPAQRDDIRLLASWAGRIFTAQDLPPAYCLDAYERVYDALRGVPGTVFLSARAGGRTVAVDLSFVHGRTAFGWQAATAGGPEAELAKVLLSWHALVRARDAGAAEFDFVGAPTEGIADYKRRFGAAERRYTVLRRQATLHRKAQSALSWARALPGPRA